MRACVGVHVRACVCERARVYVVGIDIDRAPLRLVADTIDHCGLALQTLADYNKDLLVERPVRRARAELCIKSDASCRRLVLTPRTDASC